MLTYLLRTKEACLINQVDPVQDVKSCSRQAVETVDQSSGALALHDKS